MYKSAVIGDRDSVLGFISLGFKVFEAYTELEGIKALSECADNQDVAVVFITEELASKMNDEIQRYKDKTLPAITVIPGSKGAMGLGVENMRNAVIRAVGADIMFND